MSRGDWGAGWEFSTTALLQEENGPGFAKKQLPLEGTLDDHVC